MTLFIRKALFLLLVSFLLTSCASSFKAPINRPLNKKVDINKLFERSNTEKTDELLLMMSFSGGGTRAAALAYGVLEALQNQNSPNSSKSNLAKEVDYISAVSGGSFTAAYYALFGDRLFSQFKPQFLQKNLPEVMRRRVVSINALKRISSQQYGISDLFADYYDKNLFSHLTLADLYRSKGPVVDINAVDISRGTRFSFSKSQLRAICTDPASIPVGRAVAASSAVPVVMSAISIQNHASECQQATPEWIIKARNNPEDNSRRHSEAERIYSYLKPGKRQYIHLLDGGLVDNLGVRASIARSISAGSLDNALRIRGLDHTKTLVFIVVDAANWPPLTMDESRNHPPIESIISAASSAPLVQYNKETLNLLRQQFKEWMNIDPSRQAYVIHLTFDQLNDTKRDTMLALPTSFALTDQQVEDVTQVGRQLLTTHPEYQRWLQAL